MTSNIFRAMVVVAFAGAVSAGCEGSGELIGQSVDSKFSTMMLIRNFSPVMGSPGTTVIIRGAGLDQGVKVSAGDEISLPLTTTNGTEISFTVPERPVGLLYFYITQGDAVARLPFVVTGDADTPLYLGDQSEICSSVSFRRLDGSIASGSKQCSGDAVVAQECSVEGQSGCIATASFPSIQISGLASKIAPGKSMAGISVPPAQNCND